MSENFQLFFSIALGNDIHPYEYQQALAERDWPDALIAPTGLGKTAAVVLSWAWKHVSEDQPNPPRRLVYCLPMRTLVSQTERNVTKWLQRLREASSGWKSCLPDPTDDVHVLMGGVDETRWFENPEKPAVLIGTQDMLISRALMRGYAMSRFRWPVDFALLHNDAQWVFDEVQLMGSGLATSTQLEGFRRNLGTEIAARSLWVSATLHPDWLKTIDFHGHLKVWKIPDNFPKNAKSPQVRKVIDAPKHIKKSQLTLTSAKKNNLSTYASGLAREAVSMHRENHLTLVVVNTVARAQAVYEAIRKQDFPSDRLALVHSRFRPADRKAQMQKLPEPGEKKDLLVVATQAIEAGVDISSAVMLTEIAPASSFVQRLGRVNRYGELNGRGGGNVQWIDIASGSSENEKDAKMLSAPYTPEELEICRKRIDGLTDARASNLRPPEPDDCTSQSVIREKDLADLYDTDPDLTGFDVDISPYIRDGEDTDVRVFWRDLSNGYQEQPLPTRDELCAVPVGRCADWLRSKKIRSFRLDPQASKQASKNRPTWVVFKDSPWPGLVLMLDEKVGGYTSETGFNPNSKIAVKSVPPAVAHADSPEVNDADGDSRQDSFVKLQNHLIQVKKEAKNLCSALNMNSDKEKLVSTAACWHDVGKAHKAFQERMLTNDPSRHPRPEYLLAKAPLYDRAKGRPYFRHELASTLAYLSHSRWSRDADLIAYLIASHHGKVRMSLRALPAEKPPDLLATDKNTRRFARGVWEDDELPQVEINGDTLWDGGRLTLSVMELGDHPITGSSWMERTYSLLSKHGPFRLSWLEAVLRIADWRASAKEQKSRKQQT